MRKYEVAIAITGRVRVEAEDEAEAKQLARENFINMWIDDFEVLSVEDAAVVAARWEALVRKAS
jgi:hypothetical protein